MFDQSKLLKDAFHILKIKDTGAVIFNKNAVKVKITNGEELNCFIPVAEYIGRLSSRQGFVGITKEEKASIYQWLEYCILHSSLKETKEMLDELNTFLVDKTYFINNRFTIADLMLYLSLHSIYSCMTFQEKETYNHLSRWFRLIQKEADASELYPKIVFCKTSLYS